VVRPAKRRRAPASRSAAGRTTAGGGQDPAQKTCQPLAMTQTTNLKRACSEAVVLQDERPTADRLALGDNHSAAQRDRGRPLESNPNSRLHRVVPKARSSPDWQGRDIFMNDFTFVGIDVSKDALDVALASDAKPFRVANDRDGVRKLLGLLPTPGTCLITLEGSGGYERLVIAELLERGHRVAMANPRQVRDFAKGLGILAKTDPIDARVLAKFGQVVSPRCLEKPSELQTELQQLVERRRQLIQLRTIETNRLYQATSKVTKCSIQTVLKTLEKQIDALEEQLLGFVDQHPDWKQKSDILTSTPSIGDITAMSLLADLPELGQLSREAISALAGLAPFNHDSGRLQGQRAIWGGRANVRTTLYMAALSAIRYNPPLKVFYQRLRDAGKPFKKAITAVMRKLLVILNTMLKTNSPWDPCHAQKKA
jgi:transposase